MLLFYKADFMVLSNESLAYRFFYSIRLHQGPDAGAWLPQGHLITSVHHIITWFLIKTGGIADVDSLKKSLNLFGFSSLGFDCFVMCGVFFASIKVSYIGWKERCLLASTALIPAFFIGQYYTGLFLQPDYYHLNIVLITLAVFLFQIAWLSPRDDLMPFSLKACAGAGFFAGILASNKVSMLVIGFPLLGLMAFSSSVFSYKDALKRILLMAVCSFLAFSFIFMAAGQFQIEWLKNTLPGWLMFMRYPGAESDFMEQFLKRLIAFSPVFLLFLTTILAVVFYECKEKYSLGFKAVKYTILLAAALCVFFLSRRPAFTTLSEITSIFLGLAAISATVILEKKWINKVLLAFFLIISVSSLSQYFITNMHKMGQGFSGEAEEKWNVIERLPKNSPIFCILPDNSYQWGDPFTLLIKASSDFSNWWTISENGQKLLRKLHLPELIYYTEQSFDSVASKMLNKESLTKLLNIKSGVIFWADPAGLPSVAERYPILKESIKKPGVKFRSEYLPLSKVTINILEIHSKSP